MNTRLLISMVLAAVTLAVPAVASDGRPVAVQPIVLSAAPVGGERVNLNWSGATGATVTVIRDDVQIVSTPNDGFYSDWLPVANPTTHTYRICGSKGCSNTASVYA